MGHNKEKGISGQWFYGAVCIPVFPDMMAGNRRANSFSAPALFWLVDSPKTCFILKHQPDGFFFVENFRQFCDSCVNFFEVSMTSSLAFLGCRLLGITFRQPCLLNT